MTRGRRRTRRSVRDRSGRWPRRRVGRASIRVERKRPESWCYAEACARSILSARCALRCGRARCRRRASAQLPPPLRTPAASTFTIFVRGVPIGTEQVASRSRADGWTIASSGRLGRAARRRRAPRRRCGTRADWKPLELTLDGDVARSGADHSHDGRRHDRDHRNHVSAARRREKTDTIDADALLLPSPFFGPFEALAARLKTAAAGSDDSGRTSMPRRPRRDPASASRRPSRFRPPTRLIDARRTRVTLMLPARAARRRHLGRRSGPHASRQRPGAGARSRARGHRVGRRRAACRSRGRTTSR